MTTRPTIVTVSKQAGVSVSTVSQVMRGSGRISPETRRKVLEAAKLVNYVRDNRAAAMRSGYCKEVGLLIHHITNPFNAEVLSGVSYLLEQQGYLVYILDARDNVNRQRHFLETLIGGAQGGLLWVPAHHTETAIVDLVIAQGIPTVTFLRSIEGGYFDHVGIKNADGLRQACQYLQDLGHKHIVFLGGEGDNTTRMQRISGYLSAMTEANLPTVVWDCHDSKSGGAQALPLLLQHYPKTTAMVCLGDMVAMGATLALRQMGKVVGQDLSIIGFDDIADAALWTPPLTTLAINPFALGEQLAQTLLERIAEPLREVRHIYLPSHLKIRQTTGRIAS